MRTLMSEHHQEVEHQLLVLQDLMQLIMEWLQVLVQFCGRQLYQVQQEQLKLDSNFKIMQVEIEEFIIIILIITMQNQALMLQIVF